MTSIANLIAQGFIESLDGEHWRITTKGEEVKNRSNCPACGGKLEQDFRALSISYPIVIGEEHTSSPSILDGCHCTKCGTKFVFNVAGKCPSCKGTGQYKTVTSRCGFERHSTLGQCPTCKGKGRI